MWTQLRAAAIGAAACIGFAGVAGAQGASTQDPGTITPGNLSTQRLGPNGSPTAGANDSLGAVDLRNGNRRPGAGAVRAVPAHPPRSAAAVNREFALFREG
jgi:hypothetical protein